MFMQTIWICFNSKGFPRSSLTHTKKLRRTTGSQLCSLLESQNRNSRTGKCYQLYLYCFIVFLPLAADANVKFTAHVANKANLNIACRLLIITPFLRFAKQNRWSCLDPFIFRWLSCSPINLCFFIQTLSRSPWSERNLFCPPIERSWASSRGEWQTGLSQNHRV